MPTNVINAFNRTCFATIIPGEPNTYAAIELTKRTEPIAINSITFGSQITDAADRALYRGQYVAIIRNLTIDSDTTFSTLAPLSLPPGSEILWMDFQNELGAQNHFVFNSPFILPPGDKYVIVAPSPRFSAAISTTVYYHVSLNADLTTPNKALEWRLR